MELHNVKLLTNSRFPSTLTVSFMGQTEMHTMGHFLCYTTQIFIGKPESYIPLIDTESYTDRILSVYIDFNEIVQGRKSSYILPGLYRINYIIINDIL